ncbi:hypothetical protein [Candidatus Pseudothioglobus sp. Uisw_016]|uniref:hypothetical protein n=1 Tax=Candidatus Pseudothioglobus sp. Uisw_016 TaxID=3230995 RepID=UPI003A852062
MSIKFMKKLLLILFISLGIVGSANAEGFDYHGIKSGMSREKVKTILNCEYFPGCEARDVWDYFGGMKKAPPKLQGIRFRFTSDNKLYGIRLEFSNTSSYALSPSTTAHLRAIKELYKNSITVEPQCCTLVDLIDSDLYEKEAEKIYNETIHRY